MRRFICLLFSLLCVLTLMYMHELWDMVEGQALFRVMADSAMHGGIINIADETDVDMAVFARTEAKMNQSKEVLLYECLRYHGEALGVLVTYGSPITSDQIERGEAVIMLNHTAALDYFRTLGECVGKYVTLGEKEFRIVGLYREYEPLNLLTRMAEASVIAPMQKTENARRLYIWLRSGQASPFLFQQVKQKLSEVTHSVDAGDMQECNLENARLMGQQGIRFFLLLLLTMSEGYVLMMLRGSRKRFWRHVQSMFDRYYAMRACAYSIGAFLVDFLPSVLIASGWAMYLAHCARNFMINPERIPRAFLDPESWLAKFNTAAIARNNVEAMPVFGYALSTWLSLLCWIAGLLALWMLWLGLRPKAVKRDL